VWKDLLGRSATARRALAPAYMAAGWWLWGLARARQSALWCAAWAVCTAAVLVPAALVEFRRVTLMSYFARRVQRVQSVCLDPALIFVAIACRCSGVSFTHRRFWSLDLCRLRIRHPPCWRLAKPFRGVMLTADGCVLCRYFTTPFLLLALHMQPLTRRQLALTGAAYAAIDAATICAFLFWPFAWPDGSTARFMW